jgi:hypothetical protein
MKQGRGIKWALFLSFALLTAFGCGGGGGGGSSSDAGPAPEKEPVLLHAVVVNRATQPGTVRSIADATSDKYFKDTAREGVAEIIAAGNFIINERPIPKSAEEFKEVSPGGYKVNGTVWLKWDESENCWKGGSAADQPPPRSASCSASYETAALATATGGGGDTFNGLEVVLFDTDDDGYPDLIKTKYMQALIADKIIDNGDETYTVSRGELDPAIIPAKEDGAPFDATVYFHSIAKEVIKKANFDDRIKEGDIALFWDGPNGLVLERATQIKGILGDGVDHEIYEINGDTYLDAMQFSRNQVIISNRPGEMTNAHIRFRFNGNKDGLEVSLWLVPTTYPEPHGAPIGFTTNENARTFLARAIQIAKKELESVVVPDDVVGNYGMSSRDAYVQLSTAIDRAELALILNPSPALLDYQVYLLFLTLNGAKDIGAVFAGYNYCGFDYLPDQCNKGQMGGGGGQGGQGGGQ